MNKLAIFGGTGMTGQCAVRSALEKGKKKNIQRNSSNPFLISLYQANMFV
jgi:hypothetical protein